MNLSINSSNLIVVENIQLERIGKEVGKTEILEKINNVKHIAIVTLEKINGAFTYRLYIDQEKKEAGYLACGLCKLQENGLYGMPGYATSPYYGSHLESGEIANDGENLSKIYIGMLKSNEKSKYKGIGTTLMQAAIERSFIKGCEGRIQLKSAWNSPGFYYKLGMRSELTRIGKMIVDKNPMIKEELDNAATEGREPNTQGLTGEMYLPLEAIQQWNKNIVKHPLLTKTIKKLNNTAN